MAPRSTVFTRGKTGVENPRSIAAILTDYQKFVKVTNKESKRIMFGAAEIVLKHTGPFVPVQTGALKNSGTARAIKTAKGYAAEVSYGGPNNPVPPTKNAPKGWVHYAILIHEGTGRVDDDDEGESEFKREPSKFLEKGIISSKIEVDNYITNEYKKLTPGKGLRRG